MTIRTVLAPESPPPVIWDESVPDLVITRGMAGSTVAPYSHHVDPLVSLMYARSGSANDQAPYGVAIDSMTGAPSVSAGAATGSYLVEFRATSVPAQTGPYWDDVLPLITVTAGSAGVSIAPYAHDNDPAVTLRFSRTGDLVQDTGPAGILLQPLSGEVAAQYGLTAGEYHIEAWADDQILIAQPAWLTVVALTSTSTQVSWDPVTDAYGYYIERSSTNGTTGFSQIASVVASSAFTDSTGLLSAHTYWYRVRAYDWNGPGAYTLAVSVTTP